MKIKFFHLLIVLFAVSPAISQENSASNYSCWDSLFSSNTSSYVASFTEMEGKFISKGYLDSSNAESYLQLIKTIVDSNDYIISGLDFDPLLTQGFRKCFLLNKCDSSEFLKFQEMNEKISNYQEDINPAKAFTDIQKIFTTEDFDNNLVRHYVLTFYSAAYFMSFTQIKSPETNETERAEEVAKIAEPTSDGTHNVLNVYAAPNDEVYVNDELLKITKLKEVVYNHISDTSNSLNSPEVYEKYIEALGLRKVSKQSISLTTDVKTSYEYYKWIKEIILESYTDRRNEIAIAEFGMIYEDLVADRNYNRAKIRTVHNLLHIKITEVEPIE